MLGPTSLNAINMTVEGKYGSVFLFTSERRSKFTTVTLGLNFIVQDENYQHLYKQLHVQEAESSSCIISPAFTQYAMN